MRLSGGTSKFVWIVLLSASACGEVRSAGPDGGGSDSGVGDSGGTGAGNVDGTVLDVFGTPLSGANVRLGTMMVTTAGDGQFHFAAVPSSYDLDVVTTDASSLKRLTAFRGLTTRTPEVQVLVTTSGAQTTPVSGNFAGVTFPLPSGQHIALSDTDEYFGFDQPTLPGGEDITASSFSGATGVWLGKPTFQGTIWAHQFTSSSTGAVTAYNAYARIPTSMTAGTPKTVTIAMTPLSTATVAGTVTSLPAGAGTASVAIALKHASDPFGHFLGGSTSTTGSFSIASPSGASLSVNVFASAGTTSGGITEMFWLWKANVASSATNVSLAFGTPATYGGPANGATGVKSDATFSWSAGTPAGVYMLVITCEASANYAATIFTTGTSVKLPDTTALGATWPLTKSCTWSIVLYGVVSSVDGVVAANGRNKLDRPNGPLDGARTETDGYSFTTE